VATCSPATFTFTVRVTDDLGAFSEKALSITIS
jgi:hypothetical protein